VRQLDLSLDAPSPTSEIDPALAEIAAFERDLIVQAGAGTGKTHALVTLYLHLVSGLSAARAPLSPSRILAITFTDKAAAELRERVRNRLGALVTGGLAAEPVLAASARRLRLSLPPPGVLRRALAELTRAPIGTFHAFGHALLRRHAVAAGLDPGFSLLDEGEAQQRALDAARTAVLERLAAADAEVERLVEIYGFEPRVHGGVVNAIARLRARRNEEGRSAAGMAEAYAPARVAREREAAHAALVEVLAGLSSLRDRVGELSRPRLASLVAAAQAAELGDERAPSFAVGLREDLRALRGTKQAVDSVSETRRGCLAALEALCEAEASRRAAPLAACLERLVEAAERRYAAYKRSAGVVDFADLLVLPRDLLRDVREVAEVEGARYAALLVDEFQDISRVQAELIERLDVAKTRVGGRRFVVGDRKQSIYEFRGADVAVFTERTAAMRVGGAGEVLLRRSFRSTPGVVALCNDLFARAFGSSKDVPGWGLRFDPERDGLVAVRTGAGLGAELIRAPIQEGVSDRARLLRRREAHAIAARMRGLLDGGRRPGELALLLRRYTHLPLYLEALRAADLPHYVVRGRGLYEAQEIRDIASLIAWLHDEDDRFALVAVLRSPLCGLSDDGIAALMASGELGGVLGRRMPQARLGEDDRGALAALLARTRGLRAVVDRLGPAGALREIFDVFDLRAVWAGTPDGAQRIANLEHLLARVEVLSADPAGPAGDLPGFARWLSRAVRPLDALEAAGAQIVDERDDVVRVMTVHQAKGLEFPVVFVADCGAKEREPWAAIGYDPELGLGLQIAGEIPGGRLIHTTASRRVAEVRSARARAESLRLFYVAATRARDLVVFSGEALESSGGWRAELDKLAADPRGGVLLGAAEATSAERTRALLAPAVSVEVDALPGLARLEPRAARAARVAVTQLQDFALCARRYHLFHELRLDEHPQPGPAEAAPDPSPHRADPLRAGTLAHLLLERARFGLSGAESDAELCALLRDEGYAPDEPAVAEVRAHALRLLVSDFARGLVGRPVRRELPFALSLPDVAGGVRVVRGQIDLLSFSDAGVDVVDYKHARRGELEAYRFQLEVYALAVATLYPRAPRVRVGLCFLREADPQPVWVDLPPSEEIARRLGHILDGFVGARLRGDRPGIARPGCEKIRCGYLSWCHEAPR
jgi:ATP-dependent exoDNAse (exonuclease V) beta subunit